MVVSSPSCVASRNKSVQLEGQSRHLGLLWGGGELRVLGSWSVVGAVAQRGSTLVLDMTVLATAAEAVETVRLADSPSASYTQRAFGRHA